MRLSFRVLALFGSTLSSLLSSAQPPGAALSAAELVHELRAFGQTGRVLYVAAHPDDENTRLIAYLARGRAYRTGYLSLTRGDGGQNLIGSELRDSLGLIRTHELLAARHIDGGVQFFTRANDFGFSKTATETLAIWDRAQVLSDMVRVIRGFQPDVIVTRFTPVPGGTHGHHTASAQLAIEAAQLAADPQAFPEELGHLPVWSPKRVVWNAWVGRGGLTADGMVAVDVGGFDPLLGESYGEIAARSRTMHKSQGFGSVGSRGVALEHFAPLAGEPATEDLMDGVDTTWARIPGGAGITPAVTAVLAQFDPQQPSASVPALLTIHRQLAQIAESPVIAEKRAQLDRIIAGCLGLYVESRIAQAEAVPGDALPLRLTALRRSDFPVTWRTARIVGTSERTDPNAALEFNRAATAELRHALSPEARPTHPYWLSREGTVGMFAVDDPALIARPASPAALTLEHVFEVDGQTIVVADEPVEVVDDPVHGEIRRPLRIIPPVSFAFAQELELFAPGATRTVSVTITAARAAKGDVKLTAPAGWQVEPIESAFRLAAGERATMTFQVTAPGNASTAHLVAEATVDGQTYSHRRAEIRYAHLPPLLLQPPARIKVVSLELATRGQTIGYLPGAGDVVPEALARMGYRVTTLSLDDLQTENLRRFDAVVLGVRAYNTHGTIRARLPALFTYAAAGGTVVVQYNTTADLQTDTLAPYRLRLSRDRVTEEDARVTLLAPNHPAMQQPNRITSDDFDGWVQERGLYFPDQWDESFTPLLAAADTGEPQRSGGLLVARHGEGWFVYTGLSFFRQLPDGVPGAYRLFANLVSLGR